MTIRMPALFLAHGSPMNSIEDNQFTRMLKNLASKLPRPQAILVISAHWETDKTKVLSSPFPRTIHDFGGFPDELYQIQYNAKGDPQLATKISVSIGTATDDSWGLDHGTWSVLRHVYPEADIPVIQLSIARELSLSEHFELAKSLEELRDHGVLIVGSGNISHNLRELDWKSKGDIFTWASEFDEKIKRAIVKRDLKTLVGEGTISKSEWFKAHPSLEHYIPLLYTLGAAGFDETISFPFEGFQMGSLSMRCVRVG